MSMDASNKQPYDVIIIGAGPAGLFSALELVETVDNLRVLIIDKGHKVESRKCPALMGPCTNCKICHLISGIGGAGLYSDGKVVLNLDVGGRLKDFDPTGQLRDRAMNRILEIFSRFEFIPHRLEEEPLSALDIDQLTKLKRIGLRAKRYPLAYYGSENIQSFVIELTNYLARLGVEWKLDTVVTDVKVVKDLKVVFYQRGNRVYKAYTRNVVFATGKEGSFWTSKILSKLGVSISPSWTYIGVRVETKFEKAQPLFIGLGSDPKLSYKFEDGTKIKTHCSCQAGEAIISKYFGYPVVGGHTPNPFIESDKSTFTVLLRTPASSPLSEMQILEILRRSSDLAKGKLLLQRLGDFRQNKPTNYNELISNEIQPSTLENISPGNIRSLQLPFEFDRKFLFFIEKLSEIVPKITSPDTLLYAPAIEWWMPRVMVNEWMETSISGICAVGDGAGLSQGITHAAATGLISAWSLLRRFDEHGSNLHLYKFAPTNTPLVY